MCIAIPRGKQLPKTVKIGEDKHTCGLNLKVGRRITYLT